jgi:hypothetical protein
MALQCLGEALHADNASLQPVNMPLPVTDSRCTCARVVVHGRRGVVEAQEALHRRREALHGCNGALRVYNEALHTDNEASTRRSACCSRAAPHCARAMPRAGVQWSVAHARRDARRVQRRISRMPCSSVRIVTGETLFSMEPAPRNDAVGEPTSKEDDPKYLGVRLGVLAVLHTWGQTLVLHPHLHCIVPGGGPSVDGERWVSASETFLLPVQVLARVFRGKFLAGLRKLYQQGELEPIGRRRALGPSGRVRGSPRSAASQVVVDL